MGVAKDKRPLLAGRGVESIVRSTDLADGSTLALSDGVYLVTTATTGVELTLPKPRAGARLSLSYSFGTTSSTMTVRTNSTSHTFRPTTNNIVKISSGVGTIEFVGLTPTQWAVPAVGNLSGTVTLAAST